MLVEHNKSEGEQGRQTDRQTSRTDRLTDRQTVTALTCLSCCLLRGRRRRRRLLHLGLLSSPVESLQPSWEERERKTQKKEKKQIRKIGKKRRNSETDSKSGEN